MSPDTHSFPFPLRLAHSMKSWMQYRAMQTILCMHVKQILANLPHLDHSLQLWNSRFGAMETWSAFNTAGEALGWEALAKDITRSCLFSGIKASLEDWWVNAGLSVDWESCHLESAQTYFAGTQNTTQDMSRVNTWRQPAWIPSNVRKFKILFYLRFSVNWPAQSRSGPEKHW